MVDVKHHSASVVQGLVLVPCKDEMRVRITYKTGPERRTGTYVAATIHFTYQ